MTVVFAAAAITALICAVICDGMDNSNKSVIFGCIACACSIPAYSCASILYQSGKKQLDNKTETEETEETGETDGSEENNDAE